MCLYIDYHEHNMRTPRAKTAKEDIPVYKIIHCDNHSRHRGFKYTRRKTYELGQPLRAEMPKYVVEAGFHAYVDLWHATGPYIKGYHPYYKIVRFTIPKGARYFIGKGGEIVSNKIRAGELRPLGASL